MTLDVVVGGEDADPSMIVHAVTHATAGPEGDVFIGHSQSTVTTVGTGQTAVHRTDVRATRVATGATAGRRPAEGWRVLGFGRKSEVAASIQSRLRAEGLRAHTFALTDDEAGDTRLVSELRAIPWDGIAIGGFLNGQNPEVPPTEATTRWFNRVLNLVHREAPQARLILIREPSDASAAIRRVLEGRET